MMEFLRNMKKLIFWPEPPSRTEVSASTRPNTRWKLPMES
jgi:hypothetical protein